MCGYRRAALALSTVHLECSAEPRLVGAGGTLANLIFGALFWVVARAVRQSASGRYFFWLLMTFNLFEAGGYFLFSAIGDIGDWAAIVARWQAAWAWRVALIAPGTATYFFFVGTSVRMEDLRFRPKIPAELNSAGANKLPMRPQPRRFHQSSDS